MGKCAGGSEPVRVTGGMTGDMEREGYKSCLV